MKKKIGIVTLYGNTNYGNRLQNYAIQQILRQKGFEVDTLLCQKNVPRALVKRAYYKSKSIAGSRQARRTEKFIRFDQKWVQIRRISERSGLLPASLAEEYDFFVSGSDQVWNPDIRLNEKDNFFLRFAHREQRICLSPSVAAEELPQNRLTEYLIGLNGFPYLSCREEAGTELIRQLTGRECEHLIDPTLALSADDWRAFAKEVNQSKPYILLFFLGEVSESIRMLVKTEAERRGLEIVELSSTSDRHYVSDPQNFVWLIDHAQLVMTDSFHAAAFSINLNTPFYVYDRMSDSIVENHMSSRIVSLTEKFNLSERYAKKEIDHLDFSCDFDACNAVLEQERRKFDQYLDRCLNQKKQLSFLLPDRNCTGCGVCEKVCPTECITMVADAEGFMKPTVDYLKCISCGKCVSACPPLHAQSANTNEVKQVYAAYQDNQDKLNESSSGAVFPLLAEWAIRQNGVVFGASFDEHFDVVHDWADDETGIKRFYTSKYVQSNIQRCYSQVKAFLQDGRVVLFSGTPCQIAAIKSYLGKEYENLYLVECACHGVPSPEVWRKYRTIIQKDKMDNETLNNVSFRDKTINWADYSLKLDTENRKYIRERKNDEYLKGFTMNLTLRPSCSCCVFKGKKRVADITLADFWGIDKICPEAKNEQGTSMILLNSEKGERLWKAVTDGIICTQVDAQRIIGKYNAAIWRPVAAHVNRRVFFNAIRVGDVKKALNTYAIPIKASFVKRAMRKVKRLIKSI